MGTFNGLSKEGGLLIINENGIEEVILAGDVFIIWIKKYLIKLLW